MPTRPHGKKPLSTEAGCAKLIAYVVIGEFHIEGNEECGRVSVKMPAAELP